MRKTNCKFYILLFILISLISFAPGRANAQSMGISSSSITPDASSILELRTTSKGFLIPRMTTTERDAISSPATGLIIYNSTTNNFNFYNGSSWTANFSGSSGVNSISGTTNRISIGGTSADPTVDISSGYVGQSSITTLGTIGTGTWNGSIIGLAYGGTGQTTQQAAINALTGTQTSGTYLRSNGTNASLSAIQAADVPTLNQNTTGSAATLTTSRNIYGNAFNGSADVTGIISSTYGGTGNGFTKFSGPATSEKTFTLPNASATILTDNAAVTVAQGGTGVTTLASNGVLYGNGTGAIEALPVNSSGTVQYLSQVSSGTPTWVTPTNGTVTSVSGTTNRITVATGTTTPVIDISSSYVGQSSITTLGTIGTGTWNGTLIGTTYGGTGTSTALTQGSIVFAGASGIYSQNNSKFFWDNTNFRLGLGTAAPNTAIQVGSLTNGGTDNIMLGGAASPGFMLNTLGTDFGTFYSTAANTVGIGFTPTTTVPSLAVFKVNKTGAATFGTSVSTDDNILIQPYTGGSNSFAGRITTVDLTAGRIYTLPDANGTLAVSASGNIALSSAGDISFTGALPVANGGTGATTLTGILKGNGTSAFTVATAGTDYSAGTSSLATGILKSTTSTGALSIAVAGDFPTLNQNTTGSAAILTTARNIYGNSFNGSADLNQVIASTYGGTGINNAGRTLTINTNSGTLAFPGASTTMTFPTTSATLARTDAANTFTGASTASAWVLTSPTITTGITPTTDNGAALGSTGNKFSDLFLASGGAIDFNAGNVTLTHAAGSLTVAGGGIVSAAGSSTLTPLKITNGALATTSVAGGIENDGITLYSSTTDGDRGVVPSQKFTSSTATFAFPNDANANPVFETSDDAFNVVAGTSYFFEGSYELTGMGGTTRTVSSLFAGTATLTSIAYDATISSGNANALSTTQSTKKCVTATANVLNATSTSAASWVYVRGIVRINGGGTFIPQLKLSAAPGGTILVSTNSWFRMYPIGTNTVIKSGNIN